MRTAGIPLILGVLAILCTAPGVHAASRTFSGTGDWSNVSLWGGTVPVDGDDVTIAGNVTLSNSTAFLSSYTLNAGCTHTFYGTNTFLRATNVTLSGIVTHDTNWTVATNALGVWEVSNVVCIAADSNVTVNPSGSINLDGKGRRDNVQQRARAGRRQEPAIRRRLRRKRRVGLRGDGRRGVRVGQRTDGSGQRRRQQQRLGRPWRRRRADNGRRNGDRERGHLGQRHQPGHAGRRRFRRKHLDFVQDDYGSYKVVEFPAR